MMVHIKATCIHILLSSTARFLRNAKESNHVHGYYRAHVEHLLARLWHWKVIPYI